MKGARRTGYLVVVTGIATIASVIVMSTMAGPEVAPHTKPNSGGFSSTMLWFELALTPREIFENLGPTNSEEGRARRLQLDITNKYDFAFMVCYSMYNASLVYLVTHLNVYRLRSLLKLRVFLALGILLSIAMLVGDIVENVQLLELTRVANADDIQESTMSSLIYWTRVKWGAIFAVCIMLSAGYASYFRRIPTLLIPAAYALAGVSGMIAISIPEARVVMEYISIHAITFAWAASLLHAILISVKGPAGFPLPDNVHVRNAETAEAEG
ncbi:MAG: hypothetical protein HUU46_10635 [Candidatus Hydrogenedentes bacterium]|nr:hypothetical protein [Candidatus Hydrogenedentota bacterium]